MKIRFGDEKISSSADSLDIIVALNEEIVDRHINCLKEDGVVLY